MLHSCLHKLELGHLGPRLAQLHSSHMALGKSLNLQGPPCLHLKKEEVNPDDLYSSSQHSTFSGSKIQMVLCVNLLYTHIYTVIIFILKGACNKMQAAVLIDPRDFSDLPVPTGPFLRERSFSHSL